MEVARFTELLLVYLLVLLEQNDVIAHIYQASHDMTSQTGSRPLGVKANVIDDIVYRLRRKRTVVNRRVRISQMLEYIENVSKDYERTSQCQRPYRNVKQFHVHPSEEWYNDFIPQKNTTITLANTINTLYLYSSHNDKSRVYDSAYYISLARAVVESDSKISGCGIAFARGQYNGSRYFCPYVYRNNIGTFSVVDLYKSLDYASDSEWFTYQENIDWKSYDVVKETHIIHEKINRGRPLSRPWNITLKVSHREGHWTLPYFSCNGVPTWTITYSVPFFDWEGGSTGLIFKGVVLLDIDLNQFDLDQCRSGGHMLAGSHRCRLETTTCKHIPGGGFRRGNYECHCKRGYFLPKNTRGCFNGSEVERAFLDFQRRGVNRSTAYSNCNCPLCKPGCDVCADDAPCFVEANILIRGIPLGIQSFCMTIAIVLGVVVWRLRKTKVMMTSMWILLEIVLLGALLLYATVVIQYFDPSALTCLLIPWCREVGFVVMYGALVLKLYRLLSEFQSRKAHRVHVRDKDLLKYLCCIIIIVLGFMAAWTAVNIDHSTDENSYLSNGTTDDRLKYHICKSYWWDYVIEFLELLFLFFAIYLCYCTRSAPSDYREGKYVAVAIYNETIISTVLYVTRHFLWLSLHPDYLFLMFFVRCQLSVTITLILVLGPKLWFAHRPPDDDHCRNRAYSTADVQDSVGPEAMKLNVAISSNGDVDVGEINLAEMDPEDIRLELKRLYTQLQVYRTKTMRRDNPHISKRRGGRKQTHRRFSLQAFHHKHKHHQPEQETEHEMSKTPEDSTNSAELTLPVTEGSSGRHDDHDNAPREKSERGGPTVTFKAGHKCIV